MEHPSEAQIQAAVGIVTAVHHDTWEVDVRLLNTDRGEVKRCKVVSHFLPEIHLDQNSDYPDRQEKVVVLWTDAYQQSPVCLPLHNVLVPDAEKANHVLWLELLKYRIRITRDGELELRNYQGPVLQIRVLEEDGVVELRTPKTSVVLKDADGSIAASCEGNATVDAGENIEATAGGDVTVEAGGKIEATAGTSIEATAGTSAKVQAGTSVDVQAGANITLQAGGAISITAAGAVTIMGATVAIN